MYWLTLRLIKWLALFLLASGTVGAFRGGDLLQRQKAAYWLATPGFIFTWVAGYLMAETVHTSLGSPWISTSMLLSLLSLAVTVWSVERSRANRWIAAVIALGALAGSTAAMTYKIGGTMTKDAHPTVEVGE